MPEEESSLSVERARQVLRAAKMRCTSSRVAVLQHLSAATRPLTHAEVTDQLVPKGYDKSTIYRSLVEMSECGIVSRLELGDHAWRFEFRSPEMVEGRDHPHFMCLDCGKVACLPEARVRISQRGGGPLREAGEVTEILLKGHCQDCQ